MEIETVKNGEVCDTSLVPPAFRKSVNALTLRYFARTKDKLQQLLPKGAVVEEFDNPRPVFSSLPFAYERLDTPGLVKLFKILRPYLKGAKDDWDRMLRIMGWAYSRYPRKDQVWPKPESAFEILANARKKIWDVCDSKALLLIQGLLSAGYIARYVEYTRYEYANYPDSGHAFVEVWVDALQKWVVLDPSPNACFVRKGVPLNSLEIHNLYMDFAGGRGRPEPGGMFPRGLIQAIRNKHNYGKKYDRPTDEDTRKRIFYFFNICLRNDFMSKNLRPEDPQYYIHRARALLLP